MDNVRPWGHYEILYDGPECKVKRIIVQPHQKLSLQLHFRRAEDWIVVQGTGIVVLAGAELPCKVGDHFHIPIKAEHRIQNTGDEELVFVEIQTGTYFGEDDIVRVQDAYGRS